MLNFGFKRRNTALPRANLVANIPNRYPFIDRIGKHDGPAQLRQYASVSSGTVTLYHPAIVGTETITSSGGDAPVSVVAGGIVIGVGKVWSIKDSAGHHWSHCAALTPTSVVMWDVSGLGDHLIAEGLAEAVVTSLCSTSRDLEIGTDWLDLGFTVAGDVYQVARLANGSRRIPDDTIVPALEDGSACAGYIFTGELFPENAILHYDAELEPLAEITGGVHTLNYSVLGPQYELRADGSVIDVGNRPAVDVLASGFKGLRSCGAITNLLPGDTSSARSVTLTAQAYTLQVFGAGSASCSYGTATVGAPLTFTATAGTTTFTPSVATLWILTATAYPAPYVPPGVTQPASNATATNGLWFAMPNGSPLYQALTGQPLTLAARIKIGIKSGSGPSAVLLLTADEGMSNGLMYANAFGRQEIRAYDKTTAASPALRDWLVGSVQRKYVQVNASRTHFRCGGFIEGVDTAIQWSAWTAYDGSFNPSTLYRLMLCFGNPYPIWLNKLTIWLMELSDADMLGAWS